MDRLINQITQDIAPLPAVVAQLTDHLRGDRADFHEMARVIETDSGLTAMVMSMANSPLFGSIQHPIYALDRAILSLGHARVIDIAFLYAMCGPSGSASWPEGDEQYWKHCIAVAFAAQMLARKVSPDLESQCFLAGLVHDMGKLALLNYNEEAYVSVINDAKTLNRPSHVVELDVFGITHGIASGAICHRWSLPSAIGDAVACHHANCDASLVSEIVKSANLLVKIAGIGNGGNAFVTSPTSLLLSHPLLKANEVYDILTDLPVMVDELATIVFGHEAYSKPMETGSCSVHVLAERTSDQVLVQYLLFTLGYSTRGSYTTHDGIEAKIDVDLNGWLRSQSVIAENELNLVSLRQWLQEQISMQAA